MAVATFAFNVKCHDSLYVQGAPKKNNPLGKIRYRWNCCRFFSPNFQHL